MTIEVIGENTGDDYSGTEDSEMSSANATTNYGNTTPIITSSYASYYNLIIKFSGLSNISPTVTVSSATLNLYRTTGNAGAVVDVYRVLRDWVVAEVTYNIYSTGNSWTSGGAEGSGTDHDATASDTLSNPDTDSQYYSMDVSTDVENMINGVVSNYGWVLIEQGTDKYLYFAAENGTDGQRPYLSVNWAASGGIIPQAMHHYRQMQDS